GVFLRRLEDMKCKNCGKMIGYNYSYQCYDCEYCDSVYNVLGNELAPIDQWRDEYDADDDY
ncbi:hypothetical protein NL523_29135, partial [Klebsiella pneumoniae]|nr:hypothetical protein [Klebsiella pneumoniae]MCP6663814.1 hypothetical protein [Klebsiella pneumoniae]